MAPRSIKIQKSTNWTLAQAVHNEVSPEDDLDISGDVHLWLAKSGKDVVGYALAKVFDDGGGDAGYLSLSGILPEYRGNGLQRKLIQARDTYLFDERGLESVVTYTMPYNAPSMRNLLKEGYLPFLPHNQWVGEDVVYFIKNKIKS